MTDSDTQGCAAAFAGPDVLVFMPATLILTWAIWVPRSFDDRRAVGDLLVSAAERGV
jgi:hypothetical protein